MLQKHVGESKCNYHIYQDNNAVHNYETTKQQILDK